KSTCPQRKRHGDKRSHIFRQMRDRAVRFAAAHGRAVRTLWGIHQYVSCAVSVESLVGAGRGVALNRPTLGPAEVGPFKKAANRENAFGPRRESTVAGNVHVTRSRSFLRIQRQSDVEPVGRQEARRTVWPFHESDGPFRRIIKAEFSQFSRSC